MSAVTDSAFDFKISRLAYAAVPVTLFVVVILMGGSVWFAFAAVIPFAIAWWIHHLRTHVDSDGIIAVGTLRTTTLAWDEVAGLRFRKWGSVQAVTTDGREIRLPAVGFGDMPIISAASGGRVPDPFAAEREARRAARD
ncbi:hypothetical protein nbrc107696_40510 [Gordonia spumicola]|uniref:Low molecular weight protein antigen 6 PH domain-containing protein n=1 Tax=Gordonia spumicola TaxID=589161 RepID=A0A7I9VE93_9ACTN|nr:PH domain-containing protein [Gordonia spumicola]GEE03605.1 hypothetical protein nbrc107696_40510 [Gordonia spumicola]